ncbi:MAG: hypothetical protein ACI9MC_003959 [Kiritimatiellia bacterium]|jgi:hypothetical protein
MATGHGQGMDASYPLDVRVDDGVVSLLYSPHRAEILMDVGGEVQIAAIVEDRDTLVAGIIDGAGEAIVLYRNACDGSPYRVATAGAASMIETQGGVLQPDSLVPAADGAYALATYVWYVDELVMGKVMNVGTAEPRRGYQIDF